MEQRPGDNLRSARIAGVSPAGGEAPLPIRAAARLPKHAPVGRFVLHWYFAAAEKPSGSRTKSAEEI
jgi:hypothetical protein